MSYLPRSRAPCNLAITGVALRKVLPSTRSVLMSYSSPSSPSRAAAADTPVAERRGCPHVGAGFAYLLPSASKIGGSSPSSAVADPSKLHFEFVVAVYGLLPEKIAVIQADQHCLDGDAIGK